MVKVPAGSWSAMRENGIERTSSTRSPPRGAPPEMGDEEDDSAEATTGALGSGGGAGAVAGISTGKRSRRGLASAAAARETDREPRRRARGGAYMARNGSTSRDTQKSWRSGAGRYSQAATAKAAGKGSAITAAYTMPVAEASAAWATKSSATIPMAWSVLARGQQITTSSVYTTAGATRAPHHGSETSALGRNADTATTATVYSTRSATVRMKFFIVYAPPQITRARSGSSFLT